MYSLIPSMGMHETLVISWFSFCVFSARSANFKITYIFVIIYEFFCRERKAVQTNLTNQDQAEAAPIRCAVSSLRCMNVV